MADDTPSLKDRVNRTYKLMQPDRIAALVEIRAEDVEAFEADAELSAADSIALGNFLNYAASQDPD